MVHLIRGSRLLAQEALSCYYYNSSRRIFGRGTRILEGGNPVIIPAQEEPRKKLQEFAEIELQRTALLIEAKLIGMPANIAEENATEVPDIPEFREDKLDAEAKPRKSLKGLLVNKKGIGVVLVAILAYYSFCSDIKKPCKWVPTSPELLAAAEKRILDCLKLPFTGRHVNIGPVVGSKDNEIWTVSMNEKSDKLPVVLLHGFGAGIGFWILNLDDMAKVRPVHAIDHLGFGRSSRPKFSSDPAKAERQFVDAIEEWRKRMNIDKFVLVGHSFGGYLAMSYSLTYPDSIAHLVLADPWGLPEKPENFMRTIPWYIKTLAYVLRPLNPFWAIRAAGPKGPALLERVRPDLINRFSTLNNKGTDVKFGEYIYHCNAQEPSGETAFRSLMHDYGWSKFPLIRRMSDLKTSIDMTTIYGSQSWVSAIPPDDFKKLRPESYLEVLYVPAGHHVYSDARDEFNSIILDAAARADKGQTN